MNQFLKDAWKEISHTKNIFWCNGSWILNATLIKLDQSIKGECESKDKQQTKDLQNHIEVCKGGTFEQQNNIIEDVDKITDKSDGVKQINIGEAKQIWNWQVDQLRRHRQETVAI